MRSTDSIITVLSAAVCTVAGRHWQPSNVQGSDCLSHDTGGGPDWGARTINIVAALWPERCKAMVSGERHSDASSYAKKFSGKYSHRLITGGIGHNLPQEPPQAFAEAVVDVDGY